MKISLLNGARFLPEDLPLPGNRGELRKASRNMLMAYAVVKKLLTAVPWLMAEFQAQLGVILGTGHGELQTTKEYLKSYRQQKAARPLLFQNSLHNSTLGFLSQAFAFTGPAITNSDRFFTGEKSLETAMLLLNEKQALFCLVIGIDALVPELEEPMRLMYPANLTLGEGCGAILLAGEVGMERLQEKRPTGCLSLGQLNEINYEQSGNSHEWTESECYYDSDAIEKFVLELAKPSASGKLSLHKPDGSQSHIDFTPVKETD